jgi:hypothetical protein
VRAMADRRSRLVVPALAEDPRQGMSKGIAKFEIQVFNSSIAGL